jgi:predicted secreted protein
MTTYSGTAGSVIYGGTAGTIVGNLRSWTVNTEAEVIDVSVYGSTWKTFVTGPKGWSGSFDGLADFDNAQQINLWNALLAGTKVELVMYHSGTAKIRGTAVITGNEETSTFDGVSETTFSFTGDGTLTRA